MANKFNTHITAQSQEEFGEVEAKLLQLPFEVQRRITNASKNGLSQSIRCTIIQSSPGNEIFVPKDCERIARNIEGITFFCMGFQFMIDNPPDKYTIVFV